MPLSDYTYYVTTSGNVQVYPVVNDLVFEDTEDEDRGGYVRRLTTELVFAGADFDLFYDNYEVSGLCATLPIEIRYQGSAFYNGILRVSPDRGKWDVSNCRYRTNIEPSGDWQCLFDGWEDEFNIFTPVSEVTVNTFLGTLTEYTCGPVSAGAPITVNGYFEQNVSGCLAGTLDAYSLKRARIEQSGAVYNHYATWVTELITLSCSGGSPVTPPGDGWVLITDNCPTNATYGRAPQMIYDGDYRESSGLYWDNRYLVAGGDVTEIDNAVPLNDLLEAVHPCSGDVVSDFFGINPDATYPSGSAAYTEALANLQSVVIFQKSDVKLANASNNATIGRWTLRELLNSLKTQFNIEWRVQAGGILRIEHVSYFERSQGLDLTSGANATRIAGLYSYEYDGDGIARYETWEFMEGASNLFNARRIEYGDCVGPDAPEQIVNRADRVNNDIGYIQASPDQIADDGFVFANTYVSGGNYYFVTEASEFGGDLLFNGHMSWPNLMEHYHRWRRPLPTGTLNNVLQDFESSIPRKQQAEVSIFMSPTTFSTFDSGNLVKTQLGWGEIVNLRYSAASCRLSLKIRHQ